MSDTIKTVQVDSEIIGRDTDNGALTLDMRRGGQWGSMLPKIGKQDDGYIEWLHNSPFIQRNLVAVVLQTPKYCDLIQTNGKEIKLAIKALYEEVAKTIDGLQSNLTVDSAEQTLGISGASMKSITKVGRDGVTDISLGGIIEREGRPIERLINDIWIKGFLMNPDSVVPDVFHWIDEASIPDAITNDLYTTNVLFFVPGMNMKTVEYAWLVSNMYPNGGVEVTAKRDKESGLEQKEISLSMGGWSLDPANKHAIQLAEELLANLKLWEADYNDVLLPTDAIEPALQD